jgi:ATP-binding cassette subfamily B protein
MAEENKKNEEELLGEKDRKFDLSVTKRLFKYLRPYKYLAGTALIFTVTTNLLGSFTPRFTQYAVDYFIVPSKTEANISLLNSEFTISLTVFSFIFFGVLLLRFLLSYTQEVLLNRVGQNVMFDLRSEIFTKLQYQEVAYFDKNPVGRIITRVTGDVDSLNELFTSGVIDFLGDLVIIAAIIGQMFWLNWKLAIISLVTVPLLFVVTNWFRKHARRGFDKVRTRIAKLNAFLQEHISGSATVQLFNAEDKVLERFDEINDDHRNANIETIYYYSIFYPLVDFIGVLGIALMLWFGGFTFKNYAETALTFGTLIAFVQYSQLFFQPIRDLSDKFNILQAAIVASHRIFVLLDLPIKIESPKLPQQTDKASGKIEFQNVWFAYKDENWVLKDVSFTIEAGQSIALVGHTGSGKTTVTNLLMRFYDINKGKILLDGIDIREWNLQTLRENFAVVLQDVFLFSGTLADNIRLGNKEITEDRVIWSAKEVQADNFIQKLPDNYHSIVKERGAGLSVGQKQLVSFARALAFDPKILILDEATSSIDTETEQLIQKAVTRVMQDRTSLVVAHRLSTIQRCDKILVFHHGELREAGTHNELLKLKGLYWRLFELQYADENLHNSDNSLNNSQILSFS